MWQDILVVALFVSHLKAAVLDCGKKTKIEISTTTMAIYGKEVRAGNNNLNLREVPLMPKRYSI